jgi:hypothetical protein
MPKHSEDEQFRLLLLLIPKAARHISLGGASAAMKFSLILDIIGRGYRLGDQGAA